MYTVARRIAMHVYDNHDRAMVKNGGLVPAGAQRQCDSFYAIGNNQVISGCMRGIRNKGESEVAT